MASARALRTLALLADFATVTSWVSSLGSCPPQRRPGAMA